MFNVSLGIYETIIVVYSNNNVSYFIGFGIESY